MKLTLFAFVVYVFLILNSCDTQDPVIISGELKQWHWVTLTFEGPETSEEDSLNPFLDYRLEVLFTNGSQKYTVPGFYAADGDAANSGASSGNKWRAYFTPDTSGTWQYRISFRKGENICLTNDAASGLPVYFDGLSGSFIITESDKKSDDFRHKGMIRYVGEHYLQFTGSRETFIKGGADSPENFLGYYEFDQTPGSHKYEPHSGDWHQGDPTWQNGRGKNIIGALNYLSSKGMNSVYMIVMNVFGDGKDVWPWTNSGERLRFDCSKLDQWEVMFSHMDSLGIMMHLLLSEAENSNMFEYEDSGSFSEGFAPARKLFYREMIARFAHHNAITWNLGEENNMSPGHGAVDTAMSHPNSDEQRRQFARYIRALDPYDHMIVVHNSSWDIFPPLYNFDAIEGPSMQVHEPKQCYDKTIQYRNESAAAGKKWVVCVDEIGHYSMGAMPDSVDPHHDDLRKNVLWANLMAGGAGVEWYFGYKYTHNDLNCEDWRSRDKLWDQTRIAVRFFEKLNRNSDLKAMNHLITDKNSWCLANPGNQYVIYLREGGTTRLEIPDDKTYKILWYNPRRGGDLLTGDVLQLSGPGIKPIGNPPQEQEKDWTVLILRVD